MYFAWIANILVFIYKLPQIFTLYKEKNTTGLSLYSFCIQAVGYILYILHGYYVNDDARATLYLLRGQRYQFTLSGLGSDITLYPYSTC